MELSKVFKTITLNACLGFSFGIFQMVSKTYILASVTVLKISGRKIGVSPEFVLAVQKYIDQPFWIFGIHVISNKS